MQDTHPPSRASCAICKIKETVYTCPRCSLRSCSLSCSTAHKTQTGCSGERDKAAYVPMRDYGYKDMVNDYVFLEDMGRKVSFWGNEISRRGLSRGTSLNRGRGRGGRTPQLSNRDALKQQLAELDIDVELLPDGMHRRTLNKSTWDHKKKTALLTVEWKFHNSPEQPFALLTHRNLPTIPLKSLVEKHVKSRKTMVPEWVIGLVERDKTDKAPNYAILDASHKRFRQLDLSNPLSAALKESSFIEFPTIEISDDLLVGGTALPDSPPRKRRKLSTKAGKKAIQGLVGGYGSEDDGSDVASSEEKGLLLETEYADEDEEDGDNEGVSIEPQNLLQLVQQLKERGSGEDFADDWADSDGEAVG